jgi:predicted  nucleic acid-binding Zn-ribbon protein
MPLLDQFRRGVDTAKAKADQMMQVNRVQGEITSIRREIQAVRDKIADGVMDLHQKGALSDQELEDLCTEIDGLNGQIAEKETEIANIRAETPPETPSA